MNEELQSSQGAGVPVIAGRVALAVDSVGTSVAFYRTSLGFEIEQLFDSPPYATLGKGPLRLSLSEVGNPAPDLPGVGLAVGAGAGHAAAMVVLEVADARSVREGLRASGIATLTEPWEPPWGGCRFFLADPDGYLVEVEQVA